MQIIHLANAWVANKDSVDLPNWVRKGVESVEKFRKSASNKRRIGIDQLDSGSDND